MKHSLRATALAKPEEAKPPPTGRTFAHAYAVLAHLRGMECPIADTPRAKTAETSPPASRTPTPRLRLREACMVLTGLGKEKRWNASPPVAPEPRHPLDVYNLHDHKVRAEFERIVAQLPGFSEEPHQD